LIGLQAQAHPLVRRARELVRDGAIGRLLSGVARRCERTAAALRRQVREIAATVATGTPAPVVAETEEPLTATAPIRWWRRARSRMGRFWPCTSRVARPAGNGAELRIFRTDGALVVRAEGIGIQRATAGAAGRSGTLEPVEVPDPLGLPEGPCANVARLYLRLAEPIRGGEPAQPDFSPCDGPPAPV